MDLPSSSSTPNQVREYIVRLLVTKHEVANGNAIEIAKKWQTHRGTSLRTATSKYLSDVFGSEIGPMIHSDVRLDLEYEAKWTNPFSGNLNLVLIVAAFSWGVYDILYAGQNPTTPSDILTSLAVGSLFAGPVTLTLLYCRPRDRLVAAFEAFPVLFALSAIVIWMINVLKTLDDSGVFPIKEC